MRGEADRSVPHAFTTSLKADPVFKTLSAHDYFETQYVLRKSLPSFHEHVAEWEALSEDRCFSAHSFHIERYGEHPRQTLEVFKAAPGEMGKGLAIFIHGGFWRAMQREQSRFMATPFLKRGYDCVIAEYRLMPEFRLKDLVDDTVAALRHLAEGSARLMLSSAKIIAGHSAGAHLAVYGTAQARKEGVALGETALLLFSGVFDIFPVQGTSIGDELAMQRDEVAAWSLYSGADLGGQRTAYVVGGAETDDFQRQTFLAAQILGRGKEECIFSVDTANHLTVLTAFARNDALCDAVLAALGHPSADAATR